MEVAPINERHLDRSPPQRERGLQAAEAAPDHDHAVDAELCHLTRRR
jgi:hypothetical protein